MRIGDAIGSLQLGRKKNPRQNQLCTPWSEMRDGPDAVPLSEYPRPQMVRENWICLNGWWDYSIRKAGEKMGAPDGKILVPFSPETRRSGVQSTLLPGKVLWYRRRIPGLSLPAGMRLLLHFGAVDERCVIWWNGKKAGKHRNGYLPFCIDVTDHVRPGDNELVVAVRDDTDAGHACRGKQTLQPGGMYYHAQSGIWQTVWMEMVPAQHIAGVRITPRPAEEAAEFQLTLSEDVETEVVFRFEAHGPGVSESEDPGPGFHEDDVFRPGLCGDDDLEIHFHGRSGMKFRVPVPAPRLWSPEDPFLYHFRLRAGEDEIRGYFGMRTFGTGSDGKGRPCLTLNGTPYFFHGVLDQGYWPESLMTAPADEAMIFDIREMKKLGFNMIRKHVKIEPARWYYHCDRLGMVVWQDMVNGGGPVRKLLETYLPNIVPAICQHVKDDLWYRILSRHDRKARKAFERDLISMVRILYSTPCIGLWTIFNEGWGQFDALRLSALVRKEDPTRPLDHASGWFDQGGGDLKSIHNYFRPLAVEKDPRPCVVSEYGGINCTLQGHAMSEEVYGYQKKDAASFPGSFTALMENIRRLQEQGLAGAVYTQVSDIEEETNGLLTYDRKVVKTCPAADHACASSRSVYQSRRSDSDQDKGSLFRITEVEQ